MSTLSVPTSQRQRLLSHPIYDGVGGISELRTFMESHVFAVWDFMSLVKRLQGEFAGTNVPWVPPIDGDAAAFVTALVLGEESDVGFEGRRQSHLEMYLEAMEEVGADSSRFRAFLARLGEGESALTALDAVGAPSWVREFVRETLDLALRGSRIEVAAALVHGREDLIPSMFERFAAPWRKLGTAPRFLHYLERHIQVDSEEHGPEGERFLEAMIGGDRARRVEAARAAERAIAARIRLWDRLLAHIAGDTREAMA